MLLEKEYPATHSMSTAWYLVDKDDNVGKYFEAAPFYMYAQPYSPNHL